MRSFPFRRRKESSLEASKPYIWQEDERRVRDGSCHFYVKVCMAYINNNKVNVCSRFDGGNHRFCDLQTTANDVGKAVASPGFVARNYVSGHSR